MQHTMLIHNVHCNVDTCVHCMSYVVDATLFLRVWRQEMPRLPWHITHTLNKSVASTSYDIQCIYMYGCIYVFMNLYAYMYICTGWCVTAVFAFPDATLWIRVWHRLRMTYNVHMYQHSNVHYVSTLYVASTTDDIQCCIVWFTMLIHVYMYQRWYMCTCINTLLIRNVHCMIHNVDMEWLWLVGSLKW